MFGSTKNFWGVYKEKLQYWAFSFASVASTCVLLNATNVGSLKGS